MPKVTVLMAVYNGEEHLREAIESILGQAFRDFEFLIIDDASTDSTREIILSRADPRIRLLKNETNLGLTKSLNIGLKAATGEYVARMDADDVSLPERLERQAAYLDGNPGDALVGSLADVIGEDSQLISKPLGPAPNRGMIYVRLAFSNVMAHSSAMFRRSVVEKLGGYDESFPQSQDYDLWYRVSRSCGVRILNLVLLKWRTTPSAISEKSGESQRVCAKRIFVKHVREVMPAISDRALERLIRYHEGLVLWATPADLVAFWRYLRSVQKERRALFQRLGFVSARRINGETLNGFVADLKGFMAIGLPGLSRKLGAAWRRIRFHKRKRATI